MRLFTLAAVLCLLDVTAADAQAPDPARAAQALAAIWRPIAARDIPSDSAVEQACAGAIEEIATVEASLPETLDATSLARVRTPLGLVIVPLAPQAGALASAFFFPPPNLPWFTSGLGAIQVRDEGQGQLIVLDAAGAAHNLQVGRIGARPVLRVTPQGGEVHNFVACAPTPLP